MDQRHVAEIPAYAEQHGVRSFKFYPGNAGATPWHGYIGMPAFVDDSGIFAGFGMVGRIGGLAMVHAENQHVARVLGPALGAEPGDLHTWNLHSPDWGEAEAVQRAASYAAATGARLYAVHITSGLAAEEVRRAKAVRAGAVFGETCPQYLVLHERHQAGLLAKCSPPVRTRADNEALWRALEDGTIDCVGTDHIPQSRAHKVVEGDVWRSIAGGPGHETLLPLLLSAERLSLTRVAEITSTNAARLFGLWPRRGVVMPGAEADLTLVDLQKQRVVRADELVTSADFSPYEGLELRGWPVLTLLGGRVIMREGQPTGAPTGQYLWRKAE
jgi:dihydropyrimidinase